MAASVKVGIIGTGNIFPAYVRGCRAFPVLDIVACADMDEGLAKKRGAEAGIPRVLSVAALLADPAVELVINLTPPAAHAAVSLAAIAAGKHVHSEKPLAVFRDDGSKLLAAAQARQVRLGCAPDTFLGGGFQTCRKLIDDGAIGEPVAAVAFMTSRGPESWHPNPDFFYQPGAGPLFDIGPYYLTWLVAFLGPIRRVTGSARASFAERVATSERHHGRRIAVDVPTHVAGVLDFESGPVASLIMSWDVWASNLPRIEVYGSEGSLSVPDPNIFGGEVRLRRAGDPAWREVALTHSGEVGRGIGAADMAQALRSGRAHRCSAEMADHVLEVMHALEQASQRGQHVAISSRCVRPAPLPMGLPTGELDR